MAVTAMVSASPETRSYEECTGRIEQDPAAGLDYAEAWRVEGEGIQLFTVRLSPCWRVVRVLVPAKF